MREFLCKTEADTEALGRRLVGLLSAPALIALYGELGAGKTALVRGIGAALGTGEVSSPTFTIVHEYPTDPPLIHIDAYRLGSGEELYEIGFSDYFLQKAFIVVEWAELVEDVLPGERLEVRLEGSGDEARRIQFIPHGMVYERAIDEL